MAIFTGSAANETITPEFVSPTVGTSGGTAPSSADDFIDAGGGNDIVTGGGGTDDVRLGAGNDLYVQKFIEAFGSLDGGAGFDRARLIGNPGVSSSFFSPDVVNATYAPGVAAYMRLTGVELLELVGSQFSEFFSCRGLALPDLRRVLIDPGADQTTDVVQADGSAEGDVITIAKSGARFSISGVGAPVSIFNMTPIDLFYIDGWEGNDVLDTSGLSFGDPNVRINPSAGNDRLVAGAAAETFDGGDGVDTIDYRASERFVTVDLAAGEGFGGDAHQDLYVSVANAAGSRLDDLLLGDAGGNMLSGGGGGDQLYGRDGNDQLLGGAGGDRTDGGLGNDLHVVDDAADFVIERVGEGAVDRVVASIDYRLDAGAEIERLAADRGTADDIDLTGNGFANQITGNGGGNRLTGGGGNDVLAGLGGRDVLTGGNGDDRFLFAAIADAGIGAGRDTIADFSGAGRAGGDRIDLRPIDAIVGGGDEAFAFIGRSAFTAPGQLRVFYNSSAGVTVIAGNVDADLGTDFQIALAGNQLALFGGDFSL